MDFQDIALAVKRSWSHVFSKKKFLFVFLVVIVCEMWRSVGFWLLNSLQGWTSFHLPFFSFFFYISCLQCAGIILTHFYHHEMHFKEKPFFIDLKSTLFKLSLVAIPMGVVYCVIWVALSLFFLLKAIPIIGFVFKSLFAFIPFLLLVLLIALAFVHILIVFYGTPLLGANVFPQFKLLKMIWNQFKRQAAHIIFLVLIGLVPFILVFTVLSSALSLTHTLMSSGSIFLSFFQELLIKIPCALCLTPAVIFFFNFAVESMAWIKPAPEARAS